MPKIFGAGLDSSNKDKTRFLLPCHEKSFFPGSDGFNVAKTTDGTSRTISLVHAAPDRAVLWTKPGDLELDSEDCQRGITYDGSKGFYAGFGDGHAAFVPATIENKILLGYFTPQGFENLPLMGDDLPLPVFRVPF